ncbi:MAG: hypothetical protein J5590_03370 [Clostridia bacterium]|nr:hypothetical protein [Clostridia bacterium]
MQNKKPEAAPAKAVDAAAKTAAKPAEVKPAAKPAAEKKPAEKKAEKKPAAKKPAAKKAPAAKKTTKKPAAKKFAPKETVTLQYAGAEFDFAKITKAVEADCKKKFKDTAKTLKIYVKPEDRAVYYVVNDDFSDKIEL